MARMHVRRRGRSGSTRPLREKAPTWSPLKPVEVEAQVAALAKEGKSSAVIGAYMRDQFGVPNVRLATGKSVAQILREAKLEPSLPEDITNLLKRIVNLQDHLSRVRNDKHNQRSLHLIESKLRRLAKYYVREGRLPAEWKYTTATAKLLLQ